MFPALISAFSAVVGLFNGSYGLTLSLSLVQGLKPLFAENAALWCLLVSVGVLIPFVALSIFAAKGKFWCFLLAAALYLADFVYGLFLFETIGGTSFALLIAMHVLFLAVYVLGVVFYFRADRLLQSDPKAIMGQKK